MVTSALLARMELVVTLDPLVSEANVALAARLAQRGRKGLRVFKASLASCPLTA